MKYKVEQVNKLAEKLKALPGIEIKPIEINRQEVIKLLVGEILGLQARGYSLEQVSGILKGEGIAIAPPTLRSYLQRAKVKGERKKPVRRVAKTSSLKQIVAQTTSADKTGTFKPKPDTKSI